VPELVELAAAANAGVRFPARFGAAHSPPPRSLLRVLPPPLLLNKRSAHFICLGGGAPPKRAHAPVF
jgi:hypothetical protein